MVQNVAYSKHFTINVLVVHSLILLSEVRLVGDSLQFRNGLTVGLMPLESALMDGIRYNPAQMPRVKVLKITLGTAASRGRNVEPWSQGLPVNLDTLPVGFQAMPSHIKQIITLSGFMWEEFQDWLHRHCQDSNMDACIPAQLIEQPPDMSPQARLPWRALRPTCVHICRTTNHACSPCWPHLRNRQRRCFGTSRTVGRAQKASPKRNT